MAGRWRVVPKNTAYRLSDQGRLVGPHGQCVPLVAKKGYRVARYSMHRGDGTVERIQVRDLMRDVWGVDMIPDADWVHMVRAEARADAERRKARQTAAPKKRRRRRPPGPVPGADQVAAGSVTSGQDVRVCASCGLPLPEGYWRRHPECWRKLARGEDEPLEEYSTGTR